MTLTRETGTILDRIVARTRADLSERMNRVPRSKLETAIAAMPPTRSLADRLVRPGTSVIAEFKRASPSRGRFAVEIDPEDVAREYLAGGAVAMSVLTDEPFFQGSVDDLRAAASIGHADSDPMAMLRKDFMVDEYQLLEARAAGADVILLIVAILSPVALKSLMAFAASLDLDVLTEVHTRDELEIAEDAGARIIGVNNRDLHTFLVDLSVTERLAEFRPIGSLFVSESGIFTRQDVERVEACGVDGILVGESIVLAEDRPAAIRHLRGVEL
jgi:indole-3-glycerol phosphate synthase